MPNRAYLDAHVVDDEYHIKIYINHVHINTAHLPTTTPHEDLMMICEALIKRDITLN